MKEELYAHRRINEADEDATYIGIFFEDGTLVARKQDNVPNSRFPIFYHPHLREGADFENHCPIVAKGAAAYYLYCVEEEMGIRAYREVEKVGYINKEQSQISYRNFCWSEHFKSEKMQQIWQMIKGAGKVEEYYSKTFLPQFLKEEKRLLSESKKLGCINKEIIEEAEDFLFSLAESEEEQANEQTYKYVANGIRFDMVYNTLKDRELLKDNASLSVFISQIRNGSLDLVRVKIYKVLIALALKGRMGEEWYQDILFSADTTPQKASHINKSKEIYQTFLADLYSIL